MINKKSEIKQILVNFDCFIEKEVFFTGRVLSVRKMKDYVFADLFDKGDVIQISIHKQKTNKPIYSGDLIGVKGICNRTDSGEKTVFVSSVNIINRWHADIPYKHIHGSVYNPLKSFEVTKYKRIFFSNFVRNKLRKFLNKNGFFEVQTPILTSRYNGGRSFPVISTYLKEQIGFNRTTMEEKMQALIGAGFEDIFQIGSIFRSGEEKTFLEGYSKNLNLDNGKKMIRKMLSYVVSELCLEGFDKNDVTNNIMNDNWLEIDFFNGASKYLNIKENYLEKFDDNLLDLVNELGIRKDGISPESLADKIANAIFKTINMPLIITGFPVWSSPLYKVDKENKSKLDRCRVYIPGQDGGFEIGIQENNLKLFEENVKRQNTIWNLPEDDNRVGSSELKDVISGGLPEILGFALSPDRILKIWIDDSTIDSYV